MGDLANRIVELTGGRSLITFTPARAGDPERRRPVIDKIHQRYGWLPRVDLTEGLQRTIASFRAAGARTNPPTTRIADDVARRVVGA